MNPVIHLGTGPVSHLYHYTCIPIPTKSNYLKCLTEKTENFIRRLRWKAYHFCQSNSQPVNESANGYFEFKTLTTPPPKRTFKCI